MRFTTNTLLAVMAQAFAVLAQDNAFNVPNGGYNATAGQSLTLNWTPTTSGTVSLILRSGASSDLTAGTYIAQSIDNSGSYEWSLPSDITRGSDYAVEIVDDADETKTNYTPYFVIESKNTVASSTSDISLGAPTGSSTPSISGSTSTLSTSTTALTGSASSAVSSASSAAASLSSSISSAVSSLSSAVSHSASSASHSASASASSSASAASASASSSQTTVSNNGAAMATAFPGLMGVLALGALAL